jgi:hypothetical protein
MEEMSKIHSSEPVTEFRGRPLPEPGRPAGYAALIETHRLETPLPHRLHAIGERHKIVTTEGWRLLTPRHAPEDTLAGHLTFALKWEGLDLTVLKRLFLALGPEAIVAIVQSQPTGSYARRIWFLYEWLVGARLELPDAELGGYVDVVDAKLQFAGKGSRSTRQRVRNNLPGGPDFCPLVFRTEVLEKGLGEDLAARARQATARVPADVLARAAAFLLLSDSRSSFAIEGERVSHARIQRWGQAIGQAGRNPLSVEEFLRLQRLLIGDSRFVQLGLRREGGFVGERDRETGTPLPEHISARPEDLERLMGGLVAFDGAGEQGLDPIVAAACLAFGFVYIHPFADGNGRLHRYLIHHVLAERGFSPRGLVFPVSAVMLREMDRYRRVLETQSRAVLPLIEWEPTQSGNVHVSNDTGDLYRYFDATAHAEFLFHCVRETLEQDLPEETRFLEAYDRFGARVQELVDMPAATLDLLFRLLRQNDGRLSARAREREFNALTDAEIGRVEAIHEEELGSLAGHALGEAGADKAR